MLSPGGKDMLSNCIHVTDAMSLFLGLQGTSYEKVLCN